MPDAAQTAAARPGRRHLPARAPVRRRRRDRPGGGVARRPSPSRLDANVLFASGSAELTPRGAGSPRSVAADIAARGTGEVVVTGHTDSDGSDDFNQTLSEQRATPVLAALQPASGSAVTFVAVGKGESQPVADNSTDEGKQANRRVTVVYGVKGDNEAARWIVAGVAAVAPRCHARRLHGWRRADPHGHGNRSGVDERTERAGADPRGARGRRLRDESAGQVLGSAEGAVRDPLHPFPARIDVTGVVASETSTTVWFTLVNTEDTDPLLLATSATSTSGRRDRGSDGVPAVRPVPGGSTRRTRTTRSACAPPRRCRCRASASCSPPRSRRSTRRPRPSPSRSPGSRRSTTSR